MHKLHVVLHKALKAAVADGLIPRNAAAGLKLPRITREEIDPLNQEEARRLLEAASGDRLEALYVLAITTGLRQGELLALKWEDVDLERSVLRVRRTLTRTGERLSSGEPKTKKSRRSVRLTAAAVEALQAHLSRQLEEMERHGLPLPAWRPRLRQRDRRHHQPLQPQKPLLRPAPQTRRSSSRYRFHDLRHTCATLLLSRNVNPKIVSEMLGHASIASPSTSTRTCCPTCRRRRSRPWRRCSS